MSSVIRTTISVPAELKKRMDKVKEPVNWSALACQAFEAKLGEIASKKEKNNMSDVIARLRASKQKGEDAEYKNGLTAGKHWAQHDAEAAELTALANLHERCEGDPSYPWERFFDSEYGQCAYGTSERLVFAIRPETDGDRTGVLDFWQELLGEEDVAGFTDSWLRGFADGALEVWWEVENQL